TLGKAAFWCWLIGFYVAFGPLYVLGFEGMTRRMQHYDRPEWHPWLLLAGAGALIILCGIALQIAQLAVSIRNRAQLRDATGDPWDGRSLEWATLSPPPAFNFAVLPLVAGPDPHWDFKERAREPNHPSREEPVYEPIEMPRNSATGFVTTFLAVVTGFSLIWHIWWAVILGLSGAYATFVVFAWRDLADTVIPAGEVARLDHASRATRASQASGHGAGGPAPKRIVVGYGFWIFLLSDVILFSALFASYAVLFKNTAGGPTARQLFDLRNVAIETGCLLASTFACGMASLAVARRSLKWTQIALLITGFLGLAFVLLEAREFAGLVAHGAGPTRSAFLSSFFTLVGCHGAPF